MDIDETYIILKYGKPSQNYEFVSSIPLTVIDKVFYLNSTDPEYHEFINQPNHIKRAHARFLLCLPHNKHKIKEIIDALIDYEYNKE